MGHPEILREKRRRKKYKPRSAEHRANHLASCRDAAEKRKGIKTGPRPSEVIKAMHDGLKKWRVENPDKAREFSLKNVPKDTSGEKNGNWKGGKTKQSVKWRVRNGNRLVKWRKSVLTRDGFKCKDCGSKTRLECHHIIPLGITTAFAFCRANGVTLCRECHKTTDSYCWKGQKKKRLGNLLFYSVSIPHRWHDYPTCGNWMVGENREIGVLVSELPDWRYERLVAIHEIIEAVLCCHANITPDQVDAFDFAFKGEGEPGDDPKCPYRREHLMATGIEKMLAAAMRVNWKTYESVIDAL